MAMPRVHIARRQTYACILCGKCCRRFHVRLTEAEVARLSALDWGDAADVPTDFWHRLHGHTYFRRRDDGACVFLDPANGACRMHARFGFDSKALTCRGYPHNLASTWPGEVSVVARLDCPAVQRGGGTPLSANRRHIEGLVEELGTRGGFSAAQLQGLTRAAVTEITRALVQLLDADNGLAPGARAYALFLAAARFQALGAPFLNDRETLAEVMPSLLHSVCAEAGERCLGHLGVGGRVLFREWLAAYCRRDEELVRPSALVRLGRVVALTGYAFGWGSLRAMGGEHPRLGLGRVHLWAGRAGREPSTHAAWECYRQLLVARLEGPQFFGVAYYGAPFFTGLRALLQSYALVLAAARCHAADRASRRIEAEDVQYAVGAIDHSLGRSPLLQWQAWRLLEEHFAGPRYGRLLNSLGWE